MSNRDTLVENGISIEEYHQDMHEDALLARIADLEQQIKEHVRHADTLIQDLAEANQKLERQDMEAYCAGVKDAQQPPAPREPVAYLVHAAGEPHEVYLREWQAEQNRDGLNVGLSGSRYEVEPLYRAQRPPPPGERIVAAIRAFNHIARNASRSINREWAEENYIFWGNYRESIQPTTGEHVTKPD